jgi:preprotein translocase SecE subunit
LENPSAVNEGVANTRAVTILFVIGGLVVGIFVESAITEIANAAHWENPAYLGVVTASTLVAVVTGVVSFFGLLRNAAARSFTDAVVTELLKVAWPSREETVNNTMIVIGATIFFASLLAIYDFAWAKLTGIFLYSGA